MEQVRAGGQEYRDLHAFALARGGGWIAYVTRQVQRAFGLAAWAAERLERTTGSHGSGARALHSSPPSVALSRAPTVKGEAAGHTRRSVGERTG